MSHHFVSEPRKKLISISTTDQMAKRIKAISDEKSLTRQAYIIMAINAQLEKDEKPTPKSS